MFSKRPNLYNPRPGSSSSSEVSPGGGGGRQGLCPSPLSESPSKAESSELRERLPVLLLALLLVPLAALAPALEAVHGGGQEEAGHDGHHRHGDPREDDDEEVGEREGGLALPEAVVGELRQGDAPAVHGQGALHALHTCRVTWRHGSDGPHESVCIRPLCSQRLLHCCGCVLYQPRCITAYCGEQWMCGCYFCLRRWKGCVVFYYTTGV